MQRTTERLLREMYDILFDFFGPQHWWPGETDLEIIIGAVLTQNTNWKNVEKAIDNLKERDLLSLKSLKSISQTDLSLEIRPAGYFNIKARRLKNLINFIEDRYGLDLSRLLQEDTETLRDGLLSVNGIGPETADSILLYGANRPVFVVDAYTYRILNRHGMTDEKPSYVELQALFQDHLPDEPGLFNEFHALIVKTGKEYCRKIPICGECPLMDWGPVKGLPEYGE